jgi:hypothetical protein
MFTVDSFQLKQVLKDLKTFQKGDKNPYLLLSFDSQDGQNAMEIIAFSWVKGNTYPQMLRVIVPIDSLLETILPNSYLIETKALNDLAKTKYKVGKNAFIEIDLDGVMNYPNEQIPTNYITRNSVDTNIQYSIFLNELNDKDKINHILIGSTHLRENAHKFTVDNHSTNVHINNIYVEFNPQINDKVLFTATDTHQLIHFSTDCLGCKSNSFNAFIPSDSYKMAMQLIDIDKPQGIKIANTDNATMIHWLNESCVYSLITYLENVNNTHYIYYPKYGNLFPELDVNLSTQFDSINLFLNHFKHCVKLAIELKAYLVKLDFTTYDKTNNTFKMFALDNDGKILDEFTIKCVKNHTPKVKITAYSPNLLDNFLDNTKPNRQGEFELLLKTDIKTDERNWGQIYHHDIIKDADGRIESEFKLLLMPVYLA